MNALDGTNVYHHVNVVHEYYKAAPFNYNGMDYQMDAYVHQGSLDNGWADGADIGFGSQSGQNWARSSDVIYHEYTHNVIYHLYGEFITNRGGTQAAAMDEGLADYFACSINNHDIQGESVGVSRDLSNNYSWNAGWGYHANGQVIGGACWDMRQDASITVSEADELVFDALFAETATEFDEFLDEVIYADDDDANVYTRSPNHTAILQAFSNHGITPDDPNIPITYPAVTITGPSSLMPKTWGTFTANVTGGTGPITYQWYKQETGGWSTEGTASTQAHYMHVYNDVTMKVVVTRNGITVEDTHFVENEEEGGGGGRPPLPKELANIPTEFGLSQNYPNPFNPSTDITFGLPKQSNVSLSIYDVTGAEIRSWEFGGAFGYQSVRWDATNKNGGPAAAGIYFYRLVARPTDGSEAFVQTRKMLLLK